MPLRIACDLDGTLADMDSALQDEAEHLFGPGVSVRSPSRSVPTGADGGARARPLNSQELRRLWNRVSEIDYFWETLQETEPGVVSQLAQTAAAEGWEIIFLTQRPASAGNSTQAQSQRWLRALGFELPSLYVVSGSRGRIAAALTLDVVIDDRPENCLDVIVDSTASAVLVWRDGLEDLPPGVSRLQIQVASSMAAAIAHVAGLQAHTSPLRRHLSRLRRSLRRS